MSSVKDILTTTREDPEPCNECGTPVYKSFAFLCPPCSERIYREFARAMGWGENHLAYIAKLQGWEV